MTGSQYTTGLFQLVREPHKRGRNPKELHRDTFDRLATGGAIGQPGGALAFGYIRVSSDEQADKGGGIQRQVENCHDAAKRAGLSIPWDLLYSDDESGYTLERCGLYALCDALRSPGRAAHCLVIENIDRLSRNDDWHQGYLLEHLTHAGVRVVAWKEFSSDMERKVQGMVASEGHRKDRERMRRGKDDKARQGSIPAPKPPYGYRFNRPVNENGVPILKERKLTIYEPEAEIVRMAFTLVANGRTGYQAAALLPPGPRNTKWRPGRLRGMLNNPVYKGEYMWNTHKRKGFRVKKLEPRPREEWIIVKVPSIVSPETWQRAQDMLAANRRTAKRNARHDFLFRGLLTCSVCGRRFYGNSLNGNGKDKYRCHGHTHERRFVSCSAPNIPSQEVDDALWAALVGLLRDNHLSEFLIEEGGVERAQLTSIDKEIKKLAQALERLDATLTSPDSFEPGEYAFLRRQFLEKRRRLEAERMQIQEKVVSQEELEYQRARLKLLGWVARMGGPAPDWPFEDKQRIVKALVRNVTLDSAARRFVMEGRFPRIEDVIPRAGEDAFEARWLGQFMNPDTREATVEAIELEREQMRAASLELERQLESAKKALAAKVVNGAIENPLS